MKTETSPPGPAQARAAQLALTIGPAELNRRLEQGDQLVIIDVREPGDFITGHIPGAWNLPRAQWGRLGCLRPGALHVLCGYSGVCQLAATAAVEFAEKGFSVMQLEGGYEGWNQSQLPIET